MLSQKVERGGGVFNGLRLIDLLIKLDGFLPVVAFVSQLDTGLDAPEQIRHERDKAMRGVPVSDVAQILIDAKDFLEHDDAWSITTRRQCQVTIKLPVIN